MYWQEETDEAPKPLDTDEVVDVSFPLSGRTIPVDHAYALYRALAERLPWLDQEPAAGIHSVHVAASQNGWFRPDEATGGVLHISRRTRMTLRLPRTRLADVNALAGTSLNIDGHQAALGEPSVRPLTPLPTLFARYVACPPDQPEEAFVEAVVEELRARGTRPRKLLCGLVGELRTPEGAVFTRSLMAADLSREESLELQRNGLGPGRRLGCGIFVPHKGIAPVRKAEEG
jgi:CRISPR-associated protein Cas6